MMRLVIVAVPLLFTASIAPVVAADLMAEPAAPAMAATPTGSWDGAYVGGHLGYGWGTVTDVPDGDSTGLSGLIVGGQAGYNFTLSNNIVAGVEGDLDWNYEQGAFTGLDAGYTFGLNWTGSVRGRLGIDLGQMMPYAEAGIAGALATLTDPSSVTQPGTFV